DSQGPVIISTSFQSRANSIARPGLVRLPGNPQLPRGLPSCELITIPMAMTAAPTSQPVRVHQTDLPQTGISSIVLLRLWRLASAVIQKLLNLVNVFLLSPRVRPAGFLAPLFRIPKIDLGCNPEHVRRSPWQQRAQRSGVHSGCMPISAPPHTA